jgi:aminopeptidase
MSKEAFEKYFYDVCTLDYAKMGEAMRPLVALMKKTDKVHIVGNGTDLAFSIKGINVIPCAGEMNIPDGEVFTAPVKNSINGTLSYNTPNQYLGTVFEKIIFTFKDGKIVKATSNDDKKINDILNTDEGARYIGEFAIGVNPYITKPMLDTLFDEKITGSFHFTPGASYDEAPNGNKSAIHWDLVCMQTPEYGGGEIYFDGVLIRKDGRFVVDELKALNPENLK